MRAAFATVVMLGCFSPTPPEGARCNAANQCPSPLVCDHGFCRAQLSRDDAAIDAREIDAPATCATIQLPPFPPPTINAQLSSAAGDGTPTLTGDGLEIYFKSGRTGGLGGNDIWRATRANTGASWSNVAPVTELNTTVDDLGPDVSPDGLTIWISSNRVGTTGDLDVWVSTRANRLALWSTPTHVPQLSSPKIDEGIFVSPSLLVAYLHTDRASAVVGDHAIFRATRTSPTGMWSTPVAVAELEVGASDENPWLSADDCMMYFQTDRPGGVGSADVWLAVRPTPTAPFGAPTPVPSINATAYDADPWLSPDQRHVMLVRLNGTFDILEASR